MSNLTVGQAIEVAAKDLPYGYVIEINVESGAACVELYGPDGNDINLEDPADRTLANQIDDAVTWALFLASD